jgi:hypothetical protein
MNFIFSCVVLIIHIKIKNIGQHLKYNKMSYLKMENKTDLKFKILLEKWT